MRSIVYPSSANRAVDNFTIDKIISAASCNLEFDFMCNQENVQNKEYQSEKKQETKTIVSKY